MAIQLANNKTHLVIKRDGRVESYSNDKMYKVILWACEDNHIFANQLINAIQIKIHNKIRIETLYNEVIATASNLISDLYPYWETIAKRLYLLKLHKDLGVKRMVYPKYSDILINNSKHGFYIKECNDITIFNKFINDENAYTKLENAINPAYDNLFTFGGLNLFVQKYCNKYKGQLLELPQHTYMRVAIQLRMNEGVNAIIAKYHQLATHASTEATPKMINSLRPKPAMFSCCVTSPADSLEGINESITMLCKESKFSGGTAWDATLLRATGADVEGNKGSSAGIVPYIKSYETAISGYNQGNTRSAAGICYLDSFHYQVPEFTELKLETGKDSDRARKIQYAVKWRPELTKAIKEGTSINLIDPHKTPDLFTTYGKEWDYLYAKYSNNTRIHKRKFDARKLGHMIASTAVDTGNMYIMFMDNTQKQDISGQWINQFNLCMEYGPVIKPVDQNKDPILLNDSAQFNFNGDLGLCNLASINLVSWTNLSTAKEKEQFAYTLVSSADNAITNSFYVNPLGKQHSSKWRDIGIGVSNYANMLATNKLLWNSEEARELTHRIFEEIDFYLIKASIQLAKEKSRFPEFYNTKWAEGVFPHELSILSKSNSTLNYPLKQDWELLRKELKQYGIRNCKLSAIAPTATSGKCINATPGVDPIKKLKTIEEGTYSLPFVVPNLKENRDYYTSMFDIANKDIIELAAIRQKFIHMSQSVSLPYKTPPTAYEWITDIMYAEKLGMKSIYYTYVDKEDNAIENCESCGS